jgi:hypothetical protein
MAHCIICFFMIENKSITCNSCKSEICQDCMGQFITFCSKQKGTLPICPNIECKKDILYDTLNKNISSEIMEIFTKVQYDYLITDKKEEINSIQFQKEFLEKLRNDKLEFIKASFPKGILEIIQICYKEKLVKINKNNKIHLENMELKGKAKCVNTFCKGFLIESETFTECNLCETVFCKKCENKKTRNHICETSEIESVLLKKSFVKCPKCSIPAVKKDGCNNLTCPCCNTNFHYISGKETSHGGNSTSFQLKGESLPSIEYANECSQVVIKDLQELESMRKKPGSIKSILNFISKNPENQETFLEVAKKYSKFQKKILFNLEFEKSLIEIEELYKKHELTCEKIHEIIEKLKN